MRCQVASLPRGDSLTACLTFFLHLLRHARADFFAPGVEFGEEAVAIFGAGVGEVLRFTGIGGEVVEFDFFLAGEVESFKSPTRMAEENQSPVLAGRGAGLCQ
jgi:hypothetical protein